ncbi:hypothetical protein AWH56_021275 [Anaerobacillus isosaccharinicus]|uniref:Uncharacterized protein n=1 Tax=Anaerobacillus isosaccharinicus TaxID=1532552 RepID=A0A1S2M042_9BACI|nr:hypothetical protein [Anaerobacillus isosaccharinicus]MBA5586558.1 hypothetical protein [Anaerobacillus isosaccharinicus]QOY35205.1 hypothetical protein AWH56_021275 [Anaerobacillus isosaccharinicus]
MRESPEKKPKIYLNDYIGKLLEQRKQEVIKEDIINEFNQQKGQGLTSPTTITTTEETRLLMEYIDRTNLFTLSKQNEKRGKILKLRKFFKSKRNQQVEVYSKLGGQSHYKEGKVSTIGRDFVMLTNLRERVWIPYAVIASANIVYGVPNYSNSHQHYLYDNDLRNKLLRRFGETVSKRDLLKQQFFEESLQTNLDSWKETWIVVYGSDEGKKTGKIVSSENDLLKLSSWGKDEEILIKDITYIETIRLLSLLRHLFRQSRVQKLGKE